MQYSKTNIAIIDAVADLITSDLIKVRISDLDKVVEHIVNRVDQARREEIVPLANPVVIPQASSVSSRSTISFDDAARIAYGGY